MEESRDIHLPASRIRCVVVSPRSLKLKVQPRGLIAHAYASASVPRDFWDGEQHPEEQQVDNF